MLLKICRSGGPLLLKTDSTGPQAGQPSFRRPSRKLRRSGASAGAPKRAQHLARAGHSPSRRAFPGNNDPHRAGKGRDSDLALARSLRSRRGPPVPSGERCSAKRKGASRGVRRAIGACPERESAGECRVSRELDECLPPGAGTGGSSPIVTAEPRRGETDYSARRFAAGGVASAGAWGAGGESRRAVRGRDAREDSGGGGRDSRAQGFPLGREPGRVHSPP